MYERPAFRLRVHPVGLHAALGNSAGVTLLVLGVLPWAVLAALSFAKVPGVSIWLEGFASRGVSTTLRTF